MARPVPIGPASLASDFICLLISSASLCCVRRACVHAAAVFFARLLSLRWSHRPALGSICILCCPSILQQQQQQWWQRLVYRRTPGSPQHALQPHPHRPPRLQSAATAQAQYSIPSGACSLRGCCRRPR